MAYIPGTDRTQAVLLPEVLDDYVGADNPVRFLEAVVAQLDLGALGFQRAVPAETGRPGYDPGDLLRLYLYGYLHRIRSSRRLEQETHRNVELMWLLRRLTPDFKTIADFRRDHPAALKRVGREFVLLCRELALFGGELLAIDGSKFRAVNARDRSYTPARLATLQRDIDRTIARYLRELERQDQAEAGTEGPSAEALQEKIAALQQRRARYESLQQELVTSGETVRSLTDPDSRPMMSGGRIEVCYNVQTAVDAKHKLIVAEDVTNAAGDRDQLSPLALAAQEILEAPAPVVVADQGYYHGAEIKTCLDAGLTPLVPRPLTSANEARGLYTKDDFVYDPVADAYRCPAAETLTYRSTTVELGRTIKNYRTSACGRCALKPRCTRNKDGRKLTRWVDEQLLEAMEDRLGRDRALFAQRKALSEHPFGTMKRGMDQGYFLLKGLRKVRGEFSLTALAYNLKRVLNLVAVPRLLDALA
ncbi:MAG: IS1182 family transposase [Candidatus Methylomirabilaceae bacterium]